MRSICFILGALALVACSGKDSDKKAKIDPTKEYRYVVSDESSKTVATVAGDDISIAELDHVLAFYSTNPQASSDEGRKKVLNELIEDQVMYKKAIENGFDQSPEYRINQRKLLAHEYRKYLNQKVGEEAVINDQQIELYYALNKEQYSKPAMLRLAIYKRFANDDKEYSYSLKQIKSAAEQLSADQGFGEYAKTSAHLKTAYKGGKLPWISSQTQIADIPDEVLKAGQKLEVSKVSKVIKADGAEYLLRLVDKRDSEVTALDAVRADIRAKLLKDLKASTLQNYLQAAKEEFEITVYKNNLKKDNNTDNSSAADTFGPPGFPVK